MVPPGVILKAFAELPPTTKTLPDESVAIPIVSTSVFPPPSPVLSMISVMVPPGVILKALSGTVPATKTLPDESVATPFGLPSVFPPPSPVLSMISTGVKNIAYTIGAEPKIMINDTANGN